METYISSQAELNAQYYYENNSGFYKIKIADDIDNETGEDKWSEKNYSNGQKKLMVQNLIIRGMIGTVF